MKNTPTENEMLAAMMGKIEVFIYASRGKMGKASEKFLVRSFQAQRQVQ
jgi:hypothetical protein